MVITKKTYVLIVLLMISISSILAQNNIQHQEASNAPSYKVIGTVSGEINAGSYYLLYRDKGGFIGWREEGWKDHRKEYSQREIYEIALNKAKSEWRDYPNLYLKDLVFRADEEEQPDERYYSQVIGSGEEFRKEHILKRVYRYSAKVVVDE